MDEWPSFKGIFLFKNARLIEARPDVSVTERPNFHTLQDSACLRC